MKFHQKAHYKYDHLFIHSLAHKLHPFTYAYISGTVQLICINESIHDGK